MTWSKASDAHTLIERANAMAELLETGSVAERMRILNELLARVEVGLQAVEIVLRTGAPVTEIKKVDNSVHSIVVPVVLKRCGQAMRLIVQGPHAPKAREINPYLVALLAKSHRWFEALKSGQSPSIASIAEAHGVESSDVTQAVYLAFLARTSWSGWCEGTIPSGSGSDDSWRWHRCRWNGQSSGGCWGWMASQWLTQHR